MQRRRLCRKSVSNKKATYIPHPVCKPESCKPPEEYTPGGNFDAMTTTRKDYTAKCIERTPNCKPDNSCIQSDIPLCATTETRDNYRPHNGRRPDLIVPGDNLCSRGDIDSMTTHRKDYKALPNCKVDSCKPIECANLSGVPFDANTEFKSNYRNWCQKPRESCAPVAEYKPSETPFDSNTAYNTNYKAHDICKVKSCKPEDCRSEVCDFKGDTEYKTSYNYKKAACCPVLNLAGLGYEFVQQTCDGHQVFTKFCEDPMCPSQKQHNEDFKKKPL